MFRRCTFAAMPAAFLLMLAVLFGTARDARAQDGTCPCGRYRLMIDPSVECQISVCWAYPTDKKRSCKFSTGGGDFTFGCDLSTAGIETCGGYVELIGPTTKNQGCKGDFSLPGSCCVRACWTTDEDGCPVLLITPGNACVDINC